MDWLTFISNMTGALAWPAAVGGIAWAYKSEIQQLVGGLKRLKLGPMEAEMFEKQAQEAKALADALPENAESKQADHPSPPTATAPPEPAPPPQATKSSDAAIEDYLLDILSKSPSLAIAEAWMPLEARIRQLASGTDADPNGPVVSILLELHRKKTIGKDQFSLLRKLYELHMQARSTTIRFSVEAGLDYIIAISAARRSLSPQPPPPSPRQQPR